MKNRIHKLGAVIAAIAFIAGMGYLQRHGIKLDPNAMEQVYAHKAATDNGEQPKE